MKKNRMWAGILFAVCILLSLIGIWKSVYVSADIDESIYHGGPDRRW